MLIPTFDGRDRAIGNQLAKGIFGDLGFGIKLLEVVSCLFDTSDFAHNITSGVMDIDHQSHMNALENGAASAWYLTLNALFEYVFVYITLM